VESVFAAVHKAALLKMVGTGTHVLLLDRSQVVVEVGILPHSGDRLLDSPPWAADCSCSVSPDQGNRPCQGC
jgi:hypothetical protein